MASISSDDCKNFLQQTFGYAPKDWKRVSKKKDAAGRVVREFTHPLHGRVFLAESPQGLVDISDEFSTPAQLGTWDMVRQEFDPVELAGAKRAFDDAVDADSVTMNTAAFGYHAMPGLFSFSFVDHAGEQENVVNDINKTKDPKAIVTGITVFITSRHRDYGCNHLSWAVKPFLPGFFDEVEESMFAIYERWVHIYDDERQAAVDNASIPHVELMALMRDLSSRGFHYEPKDCVFAKLMRSGKIFHS